MTSIATRDRVIELGTLLAQGIVKLAADSKSNRDWTRAVYELLKQYGAGHGWITHPRDKCYAGEYLCDFTVFEEGYGCRIACESQWLTWRSNDQDDLDWAFYKLRGVKGDIKIFVFEGTEDNWEAVKKKYLHNYAQLSVNEAFLLLRWEKPAFKRYWWKPPIEGVQMSEIEFEAF